MTTANSFWLHKVNYISDFVIMDYRMDLTYDGLN
jgi:hypothetical protein